MQRGGLRAASFVYRIIFIVQLRLRANRFIIRNAYKGKI